MLRGLGDPQRQHAVAVDRLHLLAIDLERELHRPAEGARAPLHAVQARVLRIVDAAFTAQCHAVALDRDLDALAAKPRELGRQHVAVAALVEVHGGKDPGAGHSRAPAGDPLEELLHAPSQLADVRPGIIGPGIREPESGHCASSYLIAPPTYRCGATRP